MEAKFSAGPWDMDPEGVIFSTEDGTNICATYPQNRKANGPFIASAPIMHQKLTDTVAWLDREIEDGKKHPYCVSVNDISRLTELRDDLAETLRKIGEGA